MDDLPTDIPYSGLTPRLHARVSRTILDAIQNYAAQSALSYPMVQSGEKKLRDQVRDQYGVDVGVAHVPGVLENNAVWVHPKSVPSLMEFAKGHGANEVFLDKLRQASGKGGIILTGKHAKRRGIVEHEFGHAIAGAKGNAIERLVHRPWVEQYSQYYHTFPSIFSAIIAGARGGPLAGLAAGSLVGLGTNLPRLYAEHAANRYARELLPEDLKEEVSYFPSYSTYLANSAVPAGVLGTSVGLSRAAWDMFGRPKK
jgi:hypothetical protein